LAMVGPAAPTTRRTSPSMRLKLTPAASNIRAAVSAIVLSARLLSSGVPAMTRSTSEVAVCCSSASERGSRASARSRLQFSSCCSRSACGLRIRPTPDLAFVPPERSLRPRTGLFAPLRAKITSSALVDLCWLLQTSFDHLVDGHEQFVRHGEAEHPGGRGVDDELELARLHDRQIRRLRAFEDAIDVASRAPELVVDVGGARHQLVRQPAAMFFSAAYFAAASLTMGAITLSSLTYQSDVICQFLPSQVWMRPVRAPSWSAHDTLTGLSTFSKPSSLKRSALM